MGQVGSRSREADGSVGFRGFRSFSFFSFCVTCYFKEAPVVAYLFAARRSLACSSLFAVRCGRHLYDMCSAVRFVQLSGCSAARLLLLLTSRLEHLNELPHHLELIRGIEARMLTRKSHECPLMCPVQPQRLNSHLPSC